MTEQKGEDAPDSSQNTGEGLSQEVDLTEAVQVHHLLEVRGPLHQLHPPADYLLHYDRTLEHHLCIISTTVGFGRFYLRECWVHVFKHLIGVGRTFHCSFVFIILCL